MTTQTVSSSLSAIRFDNSFARLPAPFFRRVNPTGLKNPVLVSFNQELAELLGLQVQTPEEQELLLQTMSGNALLPNSEPLAMKYTGHQFGYYNPDLGDGRGLLLGEIHDPQGSHWDLHLKGAGMTPFSRGGDGRAVLRSCIREYLCSEAMHGLGIPTTRALCIIGSQEPVYRETVETGATLLRVARTHIRFGHFEYFSYSRDQQNLKILADYLISQQFPDWQDQPERYQLLLEEAVKRTAHLMAAWQAVGFNHGVMNTDNMSILGETFDYGPFAFLDDYQSGYICNHSDYQGRYAFNQQPQIGLWNCQCLAQAMLPLVGEKAAMAALEQYEDHFHEHLMILYRAKLGLEKQLEGDALLVRDLLREMERNQVDYSIFFRQLGHFRSVQEPGGARDLFIDRAAFDGWAERYERRLATELSTPAQRSEQMNLHNPKYILRNYMAQTAIEKAQQGDFSEVNRLLHLLQKPFDEQPENDHYAALPPDWGKGMEISCSS